MFNFNFQGDVSPIFCPTCRTPYEGQISALPVNYQLRDLIASIAEQFSKQNISAEESESEDGEAIEVARYYRVVMNLAFTKAVETAMQDVTNYIQEIGKPNAEIVGANEILFETIASRAAEKKWVDSDTAEKWGEIEALTEVTKREVSAIPILWLTNRIEKLKLGMRNC